jgi:hypothetical protein
MVETTGGTMAGQMADLSEGLLEGLKAVQLVSRLAVQLVVRSAGLTVVT